MLYEFRSATAQYLTDKLDVAVWDVIPDDAAELPCVVVTRPDARQTQTAIVFDLTLDVIVLGRRQQAGGSEAELTALADDVWAVLGGTRGTKDAGLDLAVTGATARLVTVAGLDFPAYVITVETSAATC